MIAFCLTAMWKETVHAVCALCLLSAWLVWVALVFCFGFTGESLRLSGSWFWTVMGQWLFKIGFSNDWIYVQFILSWIAVMMFLMIAPLLVFNRVTRKRRRQAVEEAE
jgi:hypothetical protein